MVDNHDMTQSYFNSSRAQSSYLVRAQFSSFKSDTKVHVNTLGCLILLLSKGPYIKYVGGGAGRFYKFFKKLFVAQETMDLNISRPSNFFQKIFHGPSHQFQFLIQGLLVAVFQGSAQ